MIYHHHGHLANTSAAHEGHDAEIDASSVVNHAPLSASHLGLGELAESILDQCRKNEDSSNNKHTCKCWNRESEGSWSQCISSLFQMVPWSRCVAACARLHCSLGHPLSSLPAVERGAISQTNSTHRYTCLGVCEHRSSRCRLRCHKRKCSRIRWPSWTS